MQTFSPKTLPATLNMHLSEPVGDANQSVKTALKMVAVILARYEVRKLKRLYDAFDRDLLLPLLLGEIALYNLGALELQDAPMKELVSAASGSVAAKMKPCNAYSIALATGLPRETVRRKIHRLVELGWITRHSNGHLFVSTEALVHFGNLLNSRELPELLKTANLIRHILEPGSDAALAAKQEMA